MKKITKKGLAPYEAKGFRSGFVLLFAVSISAILLAIALGVANISFKELRFSTSAKDTNDAFFAADAGTEFALFNDKSGSTTYSPAPGSWSFVVSSLGSNAQGCAKVTVDKTVPPTTVITSKGYNVGDASCNSTNPNRVERELRTTYSVVSSGSAVSNVTWTNAAGASVSGNNLTKTAATGWGNAGASSVQSIASGDGYIEFTTSENTTAKMGGLSRGDANQTWQEIDFGLDANLDGTLYIFENGVNVLGPYGSYAPGDVFRVSVASGVVRYYQNGALIYTSSQTPTYPLVFDSALHGTAATIANAVISF